MKIHIIGHEDYLGTMELDCQQEQVQELIEITSQYDKNEEGIPQINLIGEPPKRYRVLEYAFAGYAQTEAIPMYRFNQVLYES